MNFNKINPWMAGITLIFAGSMLTYFETYRNNEFIDGISYVLVFAGWMVLFIKAIKGTIVDAKKILFKEDKAGWFKQRLASFFAYLTLIAIVFGNIFWFYSLANERKNDILENRPTEKTIAVVSGIQKRTRRSSTSYYAIFEFTAGNKTIKHPWYEKNEGDFLVGQRFEIQYSVEYPDMVKIITSVP